LLEADEYIISYHGTAKNAQLLNETISVSRAMTPCQGKPAANITLPFTDNETLKTVIQNNRDDFLKFMLRHDLHVKSFTSSSAEGYREITTLSMPPQCFTVIFNDNFARISALK
jgi:hypothetical protein